MRILFNYDSLKDDLLPQVPFPANSKAAGDSRSSDLRHQEVRNAPTAMERLAEGATRLLRHARIGVQRFLRDVERRRQARANYEVLRRLDSATLRDLGLTLDELESVAAEAAGIAERTRQRVQNKFWQSASAGLRVRKAEMFLSVAVLAAFAGVVSVAFKAPEVLAAWRATVLFV
jgi:uncharacterized protein YjiS (DUF1127 family)